MIHSRASHFAKPSAAGTARGKRLPEQVLDVSAAAAAPAHSGTRRTWPVRWGVVRLLLVLLFLLQASVAVGQLSPGPLSQAHKSLDTPTQCTSCHVLGSREAKFRCLDCHQEIATRIREGRGFHARIAQPPSSESCARCHSEHNGEKFLLIRWEPSREQFDHAKTGWALDGKHAALACERCHNPQRLPAEEKKDIQVKDLGRTFLGLSQRCQTCHEDAHRGQLGNDCQRCHTATAWKPANGFDHTKARFHLTGAHAQVACQKCHAPLPAGAGLKFTGLAFESCQSCHADPHRGAFQQTCEQCHNTGNWRRVALASKFDHSRTDFPLLGKHLSVGCTQCHARGDFKKPVAHQLCLDCHRADPHGGQFATRADRGECAACHSVEGFKPAKFTIKEHAGSAYPLLGKHAEVTCAKCHKAAGRATVYKLKFAACLDCHADEHRGQFAAAPNLSRCEACHTVEGYSPSGFTLVKHKLTSFPLTGGHAAVACNDCHQPIARYLPAKVAKFRFEDASCAACHNDPHKGQFRDVKSKIASDFGASGCAACHSTRAWKDMAGFDHGKAGFELLGTHRAVPCAGCHQSPRMEASLKNVVFRNAPQECESCHEDSHAGQFAKSGKTACAECHNSAKWRPSLFDHERARFSLAGAHKDVACALCHTTKRAVEGRPVVFYRPTATECAACHGAVVPVKASSRKN